MNSATDYVHTHVINYEPTYLALMAACEHYTGGGSLHEARDGLQDQVETSCSAMGLDPEDLLDVDYAEMISWEVDE